MSDNELLFVSASRCKLRFASRAGELAPEDLWDLSLEALDAIAVATDDKLSKLGRKSFLATKDSKSTKELRETQLQLNILKFVIETKQSEADAAKKRKASAESKAFLTNLLDRKRTAALENLTEDEIKAQIAALETEG